MCVRLTKVFFSEYFIEVIYSKLFQQVGNIEAKDDGIVSVIFYSPYLIMFGFNGIVGRSVVIHSNPIDQSRHPAVFSSTVMMVPVNKMPHPSEENILGKPLMCGVITVTNNREK